MNIRKLSGGLPFQMGSTAGITLKEAAKRYYFSESGAWLRQAAAVPFKNPLSPLDWILTNKPRSEKQPLNFLLSSLSNGNSWVKDNHRLFAIHVSAYQYIQNNALARKALNDAYFKLLNEGITPTQMKAHMVKERLDHTYFTFQKNEHRSISKDYLKTIIKVYLHYAEGFVNTNEVEPAGEEGPDGHLHIIEF